MANDILRHDSYPALYKERFLHHCLQSVANLPTLASSGLEGRLTRTYLTGAYSFEFSTIILRLYNIAKRTGKSKGLIKLLYGL
eukprot:UN33406